MTYTGQKFLGTKHPLIVQLDWTLRNGGRTRIRQARSRTRTRPVQASVRTGQRTCWRPSRPAHTSCLVCLLRPIRLRRRGPPLHRVPARPAVADRVWAPPRPAMRMEAPTRPCPARRGRWSSSERRHMRARESYELEKPAASGCIHGFR